MCVSAGRESRTSHWDGDKLSLEYRAEVRFFSVWFVSSVEELIPAVTASVLLLPGVPAPRSPCRASRSTDRDKPRTGLKKHVSIISQTPKAAAESSSEVEWKSASLPRTPWEEPRLPWKFQGDEVNSGSAPEVVRSAERTAGDGEITEPRQRAVITAEEPGLLPLLTHTHVCVLVSL